MVERNLSPARKNVRKNKNPKTDWTQGSKASLFRTWFPVASHGGIVVLPEDEEIDDVGHVVVLDGERVAGQLSRSGIDDGQLQAAQSRGFYLVLYCHNPNHLLFLQQIKS